MAWCFVRDAEEFLKQGNLGGKKEQPLNIVVRHRSQSGFRVIYIELLHIGRVLRW